MTRDSTQQTAISTPEPDVDRYAVMGNPISHSLSPRIHQAFAQQTGQAMSYAAMLVARDGFSQALDEFQRTGGRGLNITLPFKHEAWQAVESRTPRAQQARAVNTIAFRADGKRFGDNTDGAGLVRDILKNHDGHLGSRRILLLGAGGAVHGVLGPILEHGPDEVVIANRTESKAIELAKEFRPWGSVRGCNYSDLAGSRFDLVVNGTSASLAGEAPPLPDNILSENAWCYDMMYGSKPTPFMHWGSLHGAAKCLDGLGMLVEQAAESFFLWRGVRPDTALVIRAIKAYLADHRENTP